MSTQTKVIHDRFDFQLAFMALVRNFCDDPNEEDFALLKRIYVNYLPQLDWGSISTAVRDLLNLTDGQGYGVYTGNLEGKPELAKAVKPLLSSMAAYTLHYTDNLHYIDELRGTPYEKEKISSKAKLDCRTTISRRRDLGSDDPFPVIGKIDDINKLALHMVWHFRVDGILEYAWCDN